MVTPCDYDPLAKFSISLIDTLYFSQRVDFSERNVRPFQMPLVCGQASHRLDCYTAPFSMYKVV